MPAPCCCSALLASAVAVARHKFVHTTCGVHEFGLTGVERVTRLRGSSPDEFLSS